MVMTIMNPVSAGRIRRFLLAASLIHFRVTFVVLSNQVHFRETGNVPFHDFTVGDGKPSNYKCPLISGILVRKDFT